MKKIILLIALFLLSKSSFSQSSYWKQLNGPYVAGQVNCLYNNNGVLYAGTDGGVFVSTNSGASWTKKDSGLVDWSATVNAFTSVGDKVFATVDKGVISSANRGNSWTLNHATVPFFQSYYSIASSGNYVYVGTDDSNVFISSDAGLSWKWSGTAIGIQNVTSLFAFGGNVIAHGSDASYKYFWRTSGDSGKTWAPPTDTAFYNHSPYIYNYGGKPYGSINGKVYVSNDNGITWQLTALTWPAANYFQFKGRYIYGIDANNNLFLSRDSGKTWKTNRPTSLYRGGNATGFAVNGDTLVVSDYNYGMYISTDTGLSWNMNNQGMLNATIYALAINSTHIFASTKFGVYSSADDGNNWIPANKNLTGGVNAMANKNDTLFAGGSAGMFISTNNGTSWKAINSGITSGDVINAIGINGNNIYIGGGPNPCVAYISTNNGTNWQKIDTNLAASDNINAFAFMDDTVFAAAGSHLYTSTDKGKHWNVVNTIQYVSTFEGVAAFGRNLAVGTGRVIYSETGGQQWSYCSTCNFNRNSIQVIGAISDTFYAGDGLWGMYMSADSGKTWLASSPIEFIVTNFATGNGSIYMGGLNTGVWKHVSTGSGIITLNKHVPGSNSLLIYPNPAKNTITINTGSAEARHQTISVYNTMGQLITRQINNQQVFSLNINHYPAGVYLMKIISDNGSTAEAKFVKE